MESQSDYRKRIDGLGSFSTKDIDQKGYRPYSINTYYGILLRDVTLF